MSQDRYDSDDIPWILHGIMQAMERIADVLESMDPDGPDDKEPT